MKDLSKLQKNLTESDEKTRVNAAKDIGRIKESTPAVLPPLYSALKTDSSPEVRAEAANSLGQLRFSEAKAPLTEALESDPNPEVRAASADALHRVAGHASLDPLLNALGKDGSPEVRAACVKLAGKIGDQRATADIRKSLQADTSAKVRAQAAASLGELKNQEDFKLLRDTAIKDQDKDVRVAAVLAIAFVPGNDSMDFLHDALGDSSLGDSALTAVQKSGRALESPKLISRLIAMGDSSPKVDERILQVLLEVDDSRASSYIYRGITDASYTSESEYVERCVNWFKARGDISPVTRLMNDLRVSTQLKTQARIVHALGYFQDARAVPMLLDMLKSRSQYSNCLPKHLMWAMAVIGDPLPWNYLCHLHCNDPDKNIRYEAGDALYHLYHNSRLRVKPQVCKCK